MDRVAVGYINNQLTEVMQGLIHCLLLQEHSGIEVYPLGLAVCQVAVCRYFQRWDKCREGSAATGGEEDHLATGSSEGSRGYKVVAGGAEEVETG